MLEKMKKFHLGKKARRGKKRANETQGKQKKNIIKIGGKLMK